MGEVKQVFKCNVCGQIIEVLHSGAGELVCCNRPMELLKEHNTDAGNEKHLPIIEVTEQGVRVSVGSVQHSMEEQHYIEWIQLIADGKAYRKFLKPGDSPAAEFCVKAKSIVAREYCTIHGLWSSVYTK